MAAFSFELYRFARIGSFEKLSSCSFRKYFAMLNLLGCLLLSATSVFAVSQQTDQESPKTVDPVESLEPAIKAFHESLATGDTDEVAKQCQKILPQHDDVVALFGKEYEDVGDFADLASKFYELKVQVMILSNKERPKSVTKYEVFDQRKSGNKMYAKVLPLIPKETLVYRAISRDKSGGGGSGPYIYVNGRWIWFQGFDSVPEVKKDLAELVPRVQAEVTKLEMELEKLEAAKKAAPAAGSGKSTNECP